MADDRYENSTDDVAGKAIEQHRVFLEERMDSDSGLLDKLLANKTLSRKEHTVIKCKDSMYDRNSLLLDYILEKRKGGSFIEALRSAEQAHVANYLNANAEYKCEFGGDWPLTEREVSILDANQECLVDLLELVDLLSYLHSTNVINKRQMELISSQQTSFKRNDTLLDILRRRSLRDYRQTIACLLLSNQKHIAEIFENGGVLVRVYAKSVGENVSEAENEISTAIANMITSDRSTEAADRLLELVNLKVIGAKTGHSIILYIYCKTIEELQRLHELLSSGRLRDSVELWFNHLLNRSQKIAVTTLTMSTEEFQKMRAYLLAVEHHKQPNIDLSVSDAITVRAVLDFDPKQMSSSEKYELHEILELKKERRRSREEQAVKDITMPQGQLEEEAESGESKTRKLAEKERDARLVGIVGKDVSNQQEEQSLNREENTEQISIRKEERPDGYEEYEQTGIGTDEGSNSEKSSVVDERQAELRSRYSSECEADFCTDALPFSRGDKMETVPPAEIGDNVGWWLVRHLDSGQLGFIPRNRVVIDLAEEHQPVKTTVNELPMELVDIILRKAYLRYVLSGSRSPERREELLVRRLSSVERCWFQRMNRLRFKTIIWRLLSNFYRELRRWSVIFRTNRTYFLENLETKGVNERLRSADCLTDTEFRLVNRQILISGNVKLSRKNNNQELLHILRSPDEARLSNIIRCLRQSNQKLSARIAENGGVVLKATLLSGDKAKRLLEQDLLVQRLTALRDNTKRRSHKTEKGISQLRNDDVEILSCLLDRQAVVWIWCRSQTGLERLRTLNESKDLLLTVFSDLTTLSAYSAERASSITAVSICRDQFEKYAFVCPIFVNFTAKIDVREEVWGVTKLRNEIYVLCRPLTSTPHSVLVFEDWNPFHLKKKIEVNEIQEVCDVRPSEKGNCLYISDPREKCIWKLTREAGDQHKYVKWLTTNYTPKTLSVSSDGQLVVVSKAKSVLTIYGPDAELIRSIPLPPDIKNPIHAVETSVGNFNILHEWKEEEEGESGSSSGTKREMWTVSELTRDGQMVTRRFIPSDKTQQLNSPRYLSLDSDDRVFVADYWNHAVILLESDLKWKQIICPTNEKEEKKIRWPHRLCYDEENKQLIVVGNTIGQGVNVYTLNRR